MTQFVNRTGETIVLEPGEGVSGTATQYAIDNSVYRVALTTMHTGPTDEAGLVRPTPRSPSSRRKRETTSEVVTE